MGVFDVIGGDRRPSEYRAGEPDRTGPRIEPGQIWLVECDAGALSAFHASLLLHANVVLYERGLGAALAEALPTGIYAEPLPARGMAGPIIAPRARYFAADGWSVVQLVEQRDLRRLLRSAAGDFRWPGAGLPPPLAIGTIAASRYRRRHDHATDLASVAAELGADELLSLTFAPPGPRSPAQGLAFTANGLAG